MSRYFGPFLTHSLCHTLSHVSGPPKVRHTSRNPTIFSSTYINTYMYVFTGRFVLVRGGSCLGDLSGGFGLEGFVQGGFFVLTSVRIHPLQQKAKHLFQF